jgi:PAS domain S-box-containing protein
MSITDIVKEVNINRNTAGRYLENLLVSGQVEMRRLGMAKIYILSQRVPLSAVLSLSSELVVQLDNSLRIIYANEPFLMLVEADREKLLGKNIEYTPVALAFDESFTGFIENIREGIAGKEWSGEILLTAKDITLFCRIAPTVFEEGRRGVSVIFENITKRKQAERKIEESERQFRLLAENSIDMISRVKPDGTRIYVSPAYKTTLGFEPEELIGKRDEFIHPDDVEIMKSLGNALTEENSFATITFRTKHKDGHYLWIESNVKAIFDEKTRELSEYYNVTRDITERKKAEMKLQESEERYRKLVCCTGGERLCMPIPPLSICLALPILVILSGKTSLIWFIRISATG